jgi:hypothetical protein
MISIQMTSNVCSMEQSAQTLLAQRGGLHDHLLPPHLVIVLSRRNNLGSRGWDVRGDQIVALDALAEGIHGVATGLQRTGVEVVFEAVEARSHGGGRVDETRGESESRHREHAAAVLVAGPDSAPESFFLVHARVECG